MKYQYSYQHWLTFRPCASVHWGQQQFFRWYQWLPIGSAVLLTSSVVELAKDTRQMFKMLQNPKLSLKFCLWVNPSCCLSFSCENFCSIKPCITFSLQKTRVVSALTKEEHCLFMQFFIRTTPHPPHHFRCIHLSGHLHRRGSRNVEEQAWVSGGKLMRRGH